MLTIIVAVFNLATVYHSEKILSLEKVNTFCFQNFMGTLI